MDPCVPLSDKQRIRPAGTALPLQEKDPSARVQSGGVDLVIKYAVFRYKTRFCGFTCTTPHEPTFLPQRMLFFDGFEGWFVG